MKLKPLADRVVIKQAAAEEKTKGGIILTSAAQAKPEIYDVIVVGPGGVVDGKEVVMEVKAGQKVLAGDILGTVGQIPAEISMEPHIHLVISKNGKTENPESLLAK